MKPIIAINWQGNPKHEVTYTKGRSLKLEEFSLISKSYCSLLSLQKKWGSEQLASCSFNDSSKRKFLIFRFFFTFI